MTASSGERISLESYRHGDFPCIIHTFHDHSGPSVEHTHNFVELVYIRAGSAQHVHAGQRYPIYAGDCFLVAQGESHGFAQNRNLALTNVLYRPTMIDRSDRELLSSPGFVGFFALEPLFRAETGFRHKLHLSVTQQRPALRIIDELQAEYDRQQPGWRAACRALFNQLVVLLSRSFDRSLAASHSREEFEGKRRVVAEAVAYLEKHLGSRVRLAEVAAAAFVSTSTLAHTFRAQTGMSLVEYLTRMRMDLAISLLRESERSIPDVSLSLGFHDAAYFSRVFRAAAGLSPSAYRSQARGRNRTPHPLPSSHTPQRRSRGRVGA
jgi:AraC family L-rhamnose operon transcriptional activator RhaR/AraC family L-rhamnose operon regulatory protein RhaS